MNLTTGSQLSAVANYPRLRRLNIRHAVLFLCLFLSLALGCTMEHEHSVLEHEHPALEHEHPAHEHPMLEHEHPMLEHEHPVEETAFIDDGWVRMTTGIIPEGYIPRDIRTDGVVVSHLSNGSLQRLILTSPNGHYCIRRYIEDPATGGVLRWSDELDCWTLEELAENFSLHLPKASAN